MWLNFDDRKWLIFKRPLTGGQHGVAGSQLEPGEDAKEQEGFQRNDR